MMGEVLVLGGGLAGASAALELARARKPVRLLERERQPHDKVCGEFLSIEAQRDLRRLGLDPARLGAIPIDRVRLVGNRHCHEANLPFVAQGISRRLLDEALLEAAGAAGAAIERGVRVSAIGPDGAMTSDGPRFAGAMVLATGKHEVRGARRETTAVQGGFVGFKMHWRIAQAQQADIGNAVELVPFAGGYAGLQRVERNVLNVCLIVSRTALVRVGGGWEGLLAQLVRHPHLARRIGDALPLFDKPLAIAHLPYGFVHGPDGRDGLYRLGDQFALTAPLTGDGMAIALRSARLAAASIMAGASAHDYHQGLRAMVAPQVRRAMVLQRMALSPLARQLAACLLGLRPALLGKLATLTRLPDAECA